MVSIPPSPHFTPIPLGDAFNADRAHLDGGLRPSAEAADWSAREAFGAQTFRGIPFALGEPDRPNVILLASGAGLGAGDVRIDLDLCRAGYLVFLHAVEDQPAADPPGFAPLGRTRSEGRNDGNALGQRVSEYILVYEDGSEVATPILRRFAIQQRHITWGPSPFAAIPALGPTVFTTATEDQALGRPAAAGWGASETRNDSGRASDAENLWLYALPNPAPETPLRAIVLRSGEERSVVYGVSVTALVDHPLRPGVRRKLRLTLPPPAALNALGELDADSRAPAIGIDLGTVISARAALDYDDARWSGDDPDVQPTRSGRDVVVEYAAHPRGCLYVAAGDDGWRSVDLPNGVDAVADAALDVRPIGAAARPVRLRIVDKATRRPVAARLHLHGAAGEYLPPRGHHRTVNPFWFEDNYAEFVNGRNQYSYVPGECVVDLPLGRVAVEISRGYEIAPVRAWVEVTPETEELTFELERTLPWRERGWVTADTHVHFLSPQAALLEGSAEGVHVVNLLAAQWGEMFSNVGDFDGRTTFGARDFGGDGEFLVRVGTENRMQVLGHISLLGYAGSMIHPLSTGGPEEAAIGDPLEVSMAEWAERCAAQGGLVVMPHAPNPQAERAADIVLGLVHAMEMMTFNPYDAQVNPYGLADWYRYQNLGYQIPLCAGSDKMSAASLLGGIRTYAHLGDRSFTYENWMAAVRAGNTFVTVGPLVEFAVEGRPAGGRIDLPAGGGTVDVAWTVASVNVPIDQVEVVVGGLVAAQVNVGKRLATSGGASVAIDGSTWIALRVRGSYYGRHGEIAAHTSAVQAIVDGQAPFVAAEATAVLDQIEGALAYVDTLAPRPEAQRFKQLRATIEAAHNRLHQRLHRAGIFHRHTPLHHHAEPHEH
ncbi:MAG TPA: CehA/McbA family metallohydrolase [Thermomicrobiales bacterium]|nr:CehA/McbA family metallohydrolase [Thermomicrobiales bacterium]